ncbi:MAG: 50S ribosomal protein L4 [Chloroflexi bacterium]|nr:50S ribosomal protein L4 [Chloroflexota bacterium]
MQVPVYDLAGKVVEQLEVSEYVFGVPFNEALVHQVMVGQLANARQGTASTKTRSEVAGSSRKLHAQKHTGHARAGSARSPTRHKGGIVFGPHPRSYEQALPKKMRRLALRCVLSARARENELLVVQQLELSEPKTKEMVNILSALGVDSPALIVTPKLDDNVFKSARNIPGVRMMPASLLNVVDVLAHKKLLMTVDAVRIAEALWGQKPKEASNASV